MNKDVMIRKAILHILDVNVGMPVLSEKIISMSVEINNYLSNHIIKSFKDPDIKKTEFEIEENQFANIIENYINTDEFLIISQQLGHFLYDFMNSNPDIPSADLIIVDFHYDDNDYLGILKFNYKYSYVHYVEEGEERRNNIIKQPCTLPIESQKLDEFVIMNMSNKSLLLKEKKYEINGKKEFYLSKYILKCKEAKSEKEVFNIVEKAAKKIIANEYDNDIEKISTLKRVIADDYEMGSEIDIDNVAGVTFSDNFEAQENFKEEIKKAGLEENVVKVSENIERKIFKKQKLVTDTGIEINIPSDCLSQRDKVEFINNADGTLSIVIKNINNLKS